MTSVVVYSKDACGYCTQTIAMLNRAGIVHEVKKLGAHLTLRLAGDCPSLNSSSNYWRQLLVDTLMWQVTLKT